MSDVNVYGQITHSDDLKEAGPVSDVEVWGRKNHSQLIATLRKTPLLVFDGDSVKRYG